jgi:RHS repeat-associated protein
MRLCTAGEPYDPNVGFAYHRARWMDPRLGRFAGMDAFGGHPADPNSLHRYVYARNSSPNLIDPSGLIYDIDGGVAEAIIFGVYKNDHPWDVVIHPVTPFQRLSYGDLSPDIVNATVRPLDRPTQTWNEVKPLSFSGIQDAIDTYGLYSETLGPLNVLPDAAWRPDGAPLGVAARPLPDGRIMMFANLDGMVMYTISSRGRRKTLETAASRPVGQRFNPEELRDMLNDEQFRGLLGRSVIGLAVAFGVASLIGAELVEQVSISIAVGF